MNQVVFYKVLPELFYITKYFCDVNFITFIAKYIVMKCKCDYYS